MSTPGPLDTLHARVFNAITRAIPNDRFVSLSERKAVTDAVMAELVPDLRELVAAGEQAITAAGTRANGAQAEIRRLVVGMTSLVRAWRQHDDESGDYGRCADELEGLLDDAAQATG